MKFLILFSMTTLLSVSAYADQKAMLCQGAVTRSDDGSVRAQAVKLVVTGSEDSQTATVISDGMSLSGKISNSDDGKSSTLKIRTPDQNVDITFIAVDSSDESDKKTFVNTLIQPLDDELKADGPVVTGMLVCEEL